MPSLTFVRSETDTTTAPRSARAAERAGRETHRGQRSCGGAPLATPARSGPAPLSTPSEQERERTYDGATAESPADQALLCHDRHALFCPVEGGQQHVRPRR